ncbi:MAG: MBL fold metallo-hydrolase [Micrococcus sp.]|nr:MBL fold metallo-hydrolase [Micrococcus sp.]
MASSSTTPGLNPCPFVNCVTADNPSPMTLSGTNTYLIGAPGSDSCVVVDPGPAEGARAHLDAVLEASEGRTISLILLTHWHEDHTGALDLFHEATGADARAGREKFCRGAGTVLEDGERIVAGDTVIHALHTPGHTSDSFCFSVPSAGTDGAVLTGDTILGQGTTMLDHPDGTLEDYLASLSLLQDEGPARVLPAHGPSLPSLEEVAGQYLTHRRQRIQQVKDQLATLPEGAVHSINPRDLAALVYPEAEGKVLEVAAQTMAAHLRYLQDRA